MSKLEVLLEKEFMEVRRPLILEEEAILNNLETQEELRAIQEQNSKLQEEIHMLEQRAN